MTQTSAHPRRVVLVVVAAASHSLKPAPLVNIVLSMLMILMKKVLAALVVAVQVPTRPHDWAVG